MGFSTPSVAQSGSDTRRLHDCVCVCVSQQSLFISESSLVERLRGGARAPPLGLFRRVSLGGDAMRRATGESREGRFRSRPLGELGGPALVGGRYMKSPETYMNPWHCTCQLHVCIGLWFGGGRVACCHRAIGMQVDLPIHAPTLHASCADWLSPRDRNAVPVSCRHTCGTFTFLELVIQGRYASLQSSKNLTRVAYLFTGVQHFFAIWRPSPPRMSFRVQHFQTF